MKPTQHQLEELVRGITEGIKRDDFTVDYRNNSFVRVHMQDGLKVDITKFGDINLTYRGEGTQEAYLLAKKQAIADDLATNVDKRIALEAEWAEVEAELANL